MAKRFYKRVFLNRKGFHTTAFILAEVEDTSKKKDDYMFPDIDMVISDCGRQISLDFGMDDRSERLNSLRKADLLVEVFTDFRKALYEEAEHAARREVVRKREARKNKKNFNG